MRRNEQPVEQGRSELDKPYYEGSVFLGGPLFWGSLVLLLLICLCALLFGMES